MTTTGADHTTAHATDPDPRQVEAFAERLLGALNDAFAVLMVDLGHRTGLFAALAGGPATSEALARRADLEERYVREWLGAVATAGIVAFDPVTETYALPASHAACLVGEGEANLAPMAQIATHLAEFVGPVAEVFRTGGGVPYEQYRPAFTEVMDGLSRGTFDGLLIDGIVPLAGGLAERLSRGTRVADVGCGTGHSTNLLGQAFPASEVVGYDLAEDALRRGRAEAAELGLGNVRFERMDVARLPTDAGFGAVFAFDAIHDQVDPAGVLDRVAGALEPGGTFVMVDIRASSHLEGNLEHPMATALYGISTLHCTTVSLAHGGAGLGTVWGRELACDMLAEAGFVDVTVHEIPDDPLELAYVAHRPG